jgi:hypothetical protein
MVHIVISFCNLKVPGRPVLALYDPQSGACRGLRLPGELQYVTGISGLAQFDRHFYAVTQGFRPPGVTAQPTSALLAFERRTFALAYRYDFRSAVDVHSICAGADGLYAVSTGTDEVMRLPLRAGEVHSEEVCWRPEPSAPLADRYHLNAVCCLGREILVTGFGRKAGVRWDTANDGFVHNVTRNQAVVRGIDQPHSLTAVGGALAFCESRKMAVRVLGDVRCQVLPGYTRGLCWSGRHVFVASSQGRRVSRSSGQVIDNPADPGELAGRCTISRLALDDFAIEASSDLTSLGAEIYDLLPVEGTAEWPVVDARGP